METKHTPGPWKLSESASRVILGKSEHSGLMGVCVMQNAQSEHYDANARLIAAAPDMLTALEELFKHCAMIHKYGGEASNVREADRAQQLALAAIAKARGKQ